MSDELIVFKIAHAGADALRVEIAAANEMSFEIIIGKGDYQQLITDICEIAPVMMRYDADVTEAYDDAFRTQPKAKDRHAINFFVRKYQGRIKNVSVGFGEFTHLEGG